jgi:site-specific DNA-cytosine methylase
MKVLELFSGTECISNAFRARGHECYTIDWDEQFPSSWHTDISKVTAQDILERFGIPDVVWIAPNCKTYSLAAISKHRVKNNETGNLDPISKDARESDECNIHVLELLEEWGVRI